MNAQAFGKGDKQVTVGLGIGRINVNGEDAKEVAFDQHVGMEWGIANLTDKFSLGVGFEVINMWGGHNKSLINGHYDYEYDFREIQYTKDGYNWKVSSDTTSPRRRSGNGTAKVESFREDVAALVTFSMHYSPISKLDTYVKLGIGGGVMTSVTGDITDKTDEKGAGFKSANVNETSQSDKKWMQYKVTVMYRYDDLQHVEWENFASGSKGCISAMANIGATYYVTDRFGIGAEMQISTNGGNFKVKKDGLSESKPLFSIHCAYKF